jgi:hypothetical protein
MYKSWDGSVFLFDVMARQAVLSIISRLIQSLSSQRLLPWVFSRHRDFDHRQINRKYKDQWKDKTQLVRVTPMRNFGRQLTALSPNSAQRAVSYGGD